MKKKKKDQTFYRTTNLSINRSIDLSDREGYKTPTSCKLVFRSLPLP